MRARPRNAGSGCEPTAPADRTAAKRASRAETEQAARLGWSEAARVTLRREVSAAVAGAGSEREFFDRLEQAGVLVRKRYSTINLGEASGYAVGLADHTTKDGAIVWYGGGKLASDLTLPKLRARWAGPPTDECLGAPVHGVMARAVLRARLSGAAEQARHEAGFFARLRESGVLVRLRFSEISPGEVTGYAVPSPGTWIRAEHPGGTGEGGWRPGCRCRSCAAGGTRTVPAPHRVPGRSGSPRRNGTCSTGTRPARRGRPRSRSGAAPGATRPRPPIRPGRRPRRSTPPPERSGIRRCAGPPTSTAGPRGPLTGKVPHRTTEGDRLRAAARLLSMISGEEDSAMPAALTLADSLVRLAKAVSELRQAQRHAVQAAAARETTEGLYAAFSRARAGSATLKPASQARQARVDFPFPPSAGLLAAGCGGQAGRESPHRSRPASSPPSRAGPRR